eukprot:1154081-Pelagomonas_calceolata.AAC.12
MIAPACGKPSGPMCRESLWAAVEGMTRMGPVAALPLGSQGTFWGSVCPNAPTGRWESEELWRIYMELTNPMQRACFGAAPGEVRALQETGWEVAEKDLADSGIAMHTRHAFQKASAPAPPPAAYWGLALQ